MPNLSSNPYKGKKEEEKGWGERRKKKAKRIFVVFFALGYAFFQLRKEEEEGRKEGSEKGEGRRSRCAVSFGNSNSP